MRTEQVAVAVAVSVVVNITNSITNSMAGHSPSLRQCCQYGKTKPVNPFPSSPIPLFHLVVDCCLLLSFLADRMPNCSCQKET